MAHLPDFELPKETEILRYSILSTKSLDLGGKKFNSCDNKSS